MPETNDTVSQPRGPKYPGMNLVMDTTVIPFSVTNSAKTKNRPQTFEIQLNNIFFEFYNTSNNVNCML